jgi:hypothetical protein
MHNVVGIFGRRFLAMMVVGALLSGGAAAPLRAAGENEETGICTRALSDCLETAGTSGLAADWKAAIKAIVICLAGYDFCCRFIEPYIRGEGARP